MTQYTDFAEAPMTSMEEVDRAKASSWNALVQNLRAHIPTLAKATNQSPPQSMGLRTMSPADGLLKVAEPLQLSLASPVKEAFKLAEDPLLPPNKTRRLSPQRPLAARCHAPMEYPNFCKPSELPPTFTKLGGSALPREYSVPAEALFRDERLLREVWAVRFVR